MKMLHLEVTHKNITRVKLDPELLIKYIEEHASGMFSFQLNDTLRQFCEDYKLEIKTATSTRLSLDGDKVFQIKKTYTNSSSGL